MKKIIRLKHCIGAAMTCCLIAFSFADDASDAGAVEEDDMTQFIAVVNRVIASDPPVRDRQTNAPIIGDTDAEDANASDAYDTDQRHQRHLGLGFAHGVSNTDRAASTAAAAANGPLIDQCHGNGHAGTYNDGGNDDGIGRIDCGNPSPSD